MKWERETPIESNKPVYSTPLHHPWIVRTRTTDETSKSCSVVLRVESSCFSEMEGKERINAIRAERMAWPRRGEQEAEPRKRFAKQSGSEDLQ